VDIHKIHNQSTYNVSGYSYTYFHLTREEKGLELGGRRSQYYFLAARYGTSGISYGSGSVSRATADCCVEANQCPPGQLMPVHVATEIGHYATADCFVSRLALYGIRRYITDKEAAHEL